MPDAGTWTLNESIFKFGFEPSFEVFETLVHRALSALGFKKGEDLSMTVEYIWP